MPEDFCFDVGTRGSVTARIYRAREPIEATVVLGHGAGAPQGSPFMVDMAGRLSARGIDVVTFDFLYAAQGRKMPDRNETLEATFRAAIATARARGGLPTERLFVGGKSMGGRIASQVAAAPEGLVPAGLVLLGYPIHPPKKPTLRRDGHLPQVSAPTLFVQGTRDPMGSIEEIEALAKSMQNARVHVVANGDHSLALPRRDGADAQERALEGAADAVADLVRAA